MENSGKMKQRSKEEKYIPNPFNRRVQEEIQQFMSKTMQIVVAVIAVVVVLFVLIPMLPSIYYIRTIVLVGVVIAVIVWVLSLAGIKLP